MPLSFVDVSERAYIAGLLGVYELNRVELLRDVFVWAYERSCQRYKQFVENESFRCSVSEMVYAITSQL